jgi:hypothetical protein
VLLLEHILQQRVGLSPADKDITSDIRAIRLVGGRSNLWGMLHPISSAVDTVRKDLACNCYY